MSTIIPQDHLYFIRCGDTVKIGRALDRIIGRFKPGELTYIAARPGMGKSALLKRIAREGQGCILRSTMSQTCPTRTRCKGR